MSELRTYTISGTDAYGRLVTEAITFAVYPWYARVWFRMRRFFFGPRWKTYSSISLPEDDE